MRVSFSPRGWNELLEALEYHTDPAAADRFNNRVEQMILQLERFPDSGQIRSDLTRRPVRFWLIAPFWFVTMKRGDMLLLVTVVHASRNMRAFLQDVTSGGA